MLQNNKLHKICLQKVLNKFPQGIPIIKPTDMNIEEDKFQNCVKMIEQLEERLFAHPLHDTKEIADIYSLYCDKLEVGIIEVVHCKTYEKRIITLL